MERCQKISVVVSVSAFVSVAKKNGQKRKTSLFPIAANVSPSPGGEGRGEGGQSLTELFPLRDF